MSLWKHDLSGTCGFLFSTLMSASPILAESAAPSYSDYTIPSELQSVAIGRDGYSASESVEMRRAYHPEAGVTAGDIGAYFASRLSEQGPSAIVHRMGPVSELKKSPMNEIAEVVAFTDLGNLSLQHALEDERSRIKAFAVIHKGELIFEEYVGIREWDNHLWASATKILTGSVLHLLAEGGLVDLTAIVPSYLPELEGTAWDNVTVADALHMRSGLDINESRLGSSPDHPVTQLYAIAQGDTSLPEGLTLIDAVKASERSGEPGEMFEYGSINTHVIALISERVTGKPIEDLITEKIWGQAGMEGDGVLGLSVGGEPLPFGVFAARLRDLGRFGVMFTPSWNVVSPVRVFSEDYFDNVLQSAKPETYGNDYMSKRILEQFGAENVGASYQWDAVFSDGDLYKSGRTGQGLYVSPGTDTVVVWFSSAYKAELWVHAYAREIVQQVFRVD